jgi:hypothetical protein
MTTYQVECDVGTIYATVEADDEDAAISSALDQWTKASLTDGATWGVREVKDAV